MRQLVRWMVVAAMLPFSLTSWAQETEEADEVGETFYDFSDDLVEGELVRPDGELIEGRREGVGSSLITIREHFIDKMIESVEDL